MARKADVREFNKDAEPGGVMGEYGAGLNRRVMDTATEVLMKLKKQEMEVATCYAILFHLNETVFPFLEPSTKRTLGEIVEEMRLENSVVEAAADKEKKDDLARSEIALEEKGFGDW